MTTLHDDPVRRRAIQRAGADDDQADLLHAAELVVTSGLGSWTMLQRKMRLPQGHAQRVLDVLELRGVVGPEVAGHRRVLVEPSDLDAVLAELAAPPADAAPELDDDQIEELNTTSPSPADPSDTSDTASPPAVSLVKTTSPPPAAPAAPPATGAALATEEPSLVAERQPMEVEAAPDDEPAGTTTSPRRLLVGRVVDSGATLVTTLSQGEHFTARTARATFRYGWVTGQGIGSWCRRATRAANQGGAREQVAMARRSGLPDELERWDKHLDKLRNNRIKRLMRLPKAMGAVGITLAVAVVIVALVLLVVGGCAWVVWDATGWQFWWWFVGQAGYFLAALVVVVALLAIALTPIVTVRAAHTEGMKVADPPRWLLSLDERHGMDALITPARVVMALRDCGIPALRKYIESSPDGGGELLGTISAAGCGTEVDVRTPTTVPTTKLLEKRRAIAEALDRYEHELYMTSSGARVLRFWIAEPGVLDQPIGPSPLVSMPAIKANMKTGHTPFGQNLRGDLVGVSLWQRHMLITGLSNHGKTQAGRALALWLAYDVTVEFRIGDLKGVGDWDMFEGLATCYIKGPTEDQVIEVTEMLEDVVDEMERRLASGRTDWDPLVAVVDEAQVAVMCLAIGPGKRPYGGSKNTSRFFNACRKLENQGRVVNTLLWLFTQDPTDQNLPEIVREAFHIRMCLVVGTPSKSKMALGEAAVDGGAAPHLLRRDIDKGTVVMHGGVDMPRGESSITVRTYFVDDAPAWTLARGAIEKRRQAGRSTLIIDAAPVVIDHLHDIYVAMRGETKPRTVVVLGRLMEDNPAVYESWGSDDLAKALREYEHLGLDIRKSDGQSVVRLSEVEQALRERG